MTAVIASIHGSERRFAAVFAPTPTTQRAARMVLDLLTPGEVTAANNWVSATLSGDQTPHHASARLSQLGEVVEVQKPVESGVAEMYLGKTAAKNIFG